MGRANGFFIVVPEWRNFFEASDKRRDVAICTYRYTWNGTKKEHVKEVMEQEYQLCGCELLPFALC